MQTFSSSRSQKRHVDLNRLPADALQHAGTGPVLLRGSVTRTSLRGCLSGGNLTAEEEAAPPCFWVIPAQARGCARRRPTLASISRRGNKMEKASAGGAWWESVPGEGFIYISTGRSGLVLRLFHCRELLPGANRMGFSSFPPVLIEEASALWPGINRGDLTRPPSTEHEAAVGRSRDGEGFPGKSTTRGWLGEPRKSCSRWWIQLPPGLALPRVGGRWRRRRLPALLPVLLAPYSPPVLTTIGSGHMCCSTRQKVIVSGPASDGLGRFESFRMCLQARHGFWVAWETKGLAACMTRGRHPGQVNANHITAWTKFRPQRCSR
jgi:hypothetical protein